MDKTGENKRSTSLLPNTCLIASQKALKLVADAARRDWDCDRTQWPRGSRCCVKPCQVCGPRRTARAAGSATPLFVAPGFSGSALYSRAARASGARERCTACQHVLLDPQVAADERVGDVLTRRAAMQRQHSLESAAALAQCAQRLIQHSARASVPPRRGKGAEESSQAVVEVPCTSLVRVLPLASLCTSPRASSCPSACSSPPHSYRTKDGLWSPLGGREARRGPPHTPTVLHGRRGGAERRVLMRTLLSCLALLPHKYKFGLPPGTESANLPPFIPFFFARAAQAVLPR